MNRWKLAVLSLPASWGLCWFRRFVLSLLPPKAPRLTRFQQARIGRLTGHTSGVCTVTWSPDGKTLVSGGWDKTIRLWNPVDGKEVRRLPGSQDSDLSVAWSPDGKLLASASVNNYKTIRLWEPATGKEIRLLTGHKHAMWSVAWSPDGRMLASAGFDGCVRLWDVATGKETRLLGSYDQAVAVVAWSPDGKTLAWGGWDGIIRLWDVATDKKRTIRLPDPGGTVESVCWSPDGAMIASAGNDKIVRLWDVAASKLIRKLAGHHEGVRSVVWSPDGRWLASGSLDQRVLLWEAATGSQATQFMGHAKAVMSLSWSPDSKHLASASADNTILIWAVIPRSDESSLHLDPSQLKSCLADLAGPSAARALLAIRCLRQWAKESVPLLAQQMKPVPPPDTKHVSRLIADLDSNRFAVRVHAAKELDQLGGAVEPCVRKILAQKPSLEVTRRIEQLLKQITQLSPESLQLIRAVAVLEYIGSPEAKQLLEKLATGAEGARLTKEAKASLHRLNKRAVAAK